jgi:hypothetical protein
MYNSVVVNILGDIWRVLAESYQYSFLKKINHFVGSGIRKTSKGSNVVRLFTSNRSLIEESFLYGIYCKAIDVINKIFIKLRRGINKNNPGSIIYNTVYSLFQSEVQVQRTFYVFFISFGIGIILNNVIRGFFAGKSYIVALALIFVSIVGLKAKEDYKEILRGSHFCAFMRSIFTIDEGVNQWW